MNKRDGSGVRREWDLAQLCRCAGVHPVAVLPEGSVTVTALTDDSRSVEPGTCFVAVAGNGVDGHDFLDQAIAAGATSVVVQRECSVPDSVVRVLVRDSRLALAHLAATYWGLSGKSDHPLKLIGITGTNGKTTVAWLLRSVLVRAGHVTGLLGTIEYDLVSDRFPAVLTTPGPIDLCRHLATVRASGASFGVLEVSSHALDQRRCDGLTFAVAVFTNLSGDHLDYHGDMQAYAGAKARLFDLLDVNGVAVINIDDPMGRSLARTVSANVVTFAVRSKDADLTAEIRSADRFGTNIEIRGRTGEQSIRSSLLGEHNVSNTLACAAIGEALGLPPSEVTAGLEGVQSIPGRLQRVESRDCPFSVLVDYAHTDVALANALATVRPLTPGRLICVFGCGGDRDRTKRPRMAKAVSEHADLAIVTSDNPRTEDPQRIVDEILAGFGPSASCQVQSDVDRRMAIESAIAQAKPGDTVLIAGKGHETYQLVGNAARSFDDVDVARECMSKRDVMEAIL